MTMTETMQTGEVAARPPKVDPELVERLMADAGEEADLLGPEGLLSEMTKAVLERALKTELTADLGYEPGDPAGRGSGNSRNGSYPKTVLTDIGAVDLDVPRDRNGTFEPKLIPKGSTRLDGFNERVIALYARGMTVRDVQAHLKEIYSVDVSPDLISTITDAVLDELREWQNRPLDAVYPVIYLDAIVCKVRHEGQVRNKAAHIAIGVDVDGRKHVLGIWIETAEGAKFWLRVITELRNRGVEDVLFVCCDGLKGLPEAIEAVWPRTSVQTCVVHLVRGSLRFCSYKDRKAVVAGLKPIYRAVNADVALDMLDAFRDRLGQEVSRDREDVARRLGTLRAVPRLPARDPHGDLHHQRDRVTELPAAQGDQDPRPVPHRPSPAETALPCSQKPRQSRPLRRHLQRHLALA